MPRQITMPMLSAGMEVGTLARWLKKSGDKVARGEIIAEIETDKATMELEADGEGVLGEVLVEDGTEGVPINTPIATLLENGDASSAGKPNERPRSTPNGSLPAGKIAQEIVRATSLDLDQAKPPRSVVASPLARRLAKDRGIDLTGLEGSGPKGRIVRVDVERAQSKSLPPKHAPAPERPAVPIPVPIEQRLPYAPSSYTKVPHTNIRRTIARRLTQAKTSIPHYYLDVDCCIEQAQEWRSKINASLEPTARISLNDFVIKAAAAALSRVPDVNAVWTEDALLMLKDIDISVAVATDQGLMTPIIRGVDRLTLGAVSREARELALRAKASKLNPNEFQGGSLTISNLGMFGVKSFSAILNPPQCCILAVGAAEQRPIVRDGKIEIAGMMSCTLSVDHRVADGATGARYLAAFKDAIEHPLSLLI